MQKSFDKKLKKIQSVDDLYSVHTEKTIKYKNTMLVRPFNYLFFTPLYGVRNTGCPQISTQKISPNWQQKNKNKFFLDLIDPPETFSAPQNAQFCS
jgi:hypothetical protein